MLYAHGNAADLGVMIGGLTHLARHCRCDVVVFDYPGYGLANRSVLTEQRVYAAAEAVVRAILTPTDKSVLLPPNAPPLGPKLVLYGRSLGTAVCTYLAALLSDAAAYEEARARGERAERFARRVVLKHIRLALGTYANANNNAAADGTAAVATGAANASANASAGAGGAKPASATVRIPPFHPPYPQPRYIGGLPIRSPRALIGLILDSPFLSVLRTKVPNVCLGPPDEGRRAAASRPAANGKPAGASAGGVEEDWGAIGRQGREAWRAYVAALDDKLSRMAVEAVAKQMALPMPPLANNNSSINSSNIASASGAVAAAAASPSSNSNAGAKKISMINLYDITLPSNLNNNSNSNSNSSNSESALSTPLDCGVSTTYALDPFGFPPLPLTTPRQPTSTALTVTAPAPASRAATAAASAAAAGALAASSSSAGGGAAAGSGSAAGSAGCFGRVFSCGRRGASASEVCLNRKTDTVAAVPTATCRVSIPVETLTRWGAPAAGGGKQAAAAVAGSGTATLAPPESAIIGNNNNNSSSNSNESTEAKSSGADALSNSAAHSQQMKPLSIMTDEEAADSLVGIKANANMSVVNNASGHSANTDASTSTTLTLDPAAAAAAADSDAVDTELVGPHGSASCAYVLSTAAVASSRLPQSWRCDMFCTVDRIARVRVPVLISHGLRDTVVPPHHARRLHALLRPDCAYPPAWLPDKGHNDMPKFWIYNVAAERDPGQRRLLEQKNKDNTECIFGLRRFLKHCVAKGEAKDREWGEDEVEEVLTKYGVSVREESLSNLSPLDSACKTPVDTNNAANANNANAAVPAAEGKKLTDANAADNSTANATGAGAGSTAVVVCGGEFRGPVSPLVAAEQAAEAAAAAGAVTRGMPPSASLTLTMTPYNNYTCTTSTSAGSSSVNAAAGAGAGAAGARGDSNNNCSSSVSSAKNAGAGAGTCGHAATVNVGGGLSFIARAYGEDGRSDLYAPPPPLHSTGANGSNGGHGHNGCNDNDVNLMTPLGSPVLSPNPTNGNNGSLGTGGASAGFASSAAVVPLSLSLPSSQQQGSSASTGANAAPSSHGNAAGNNLSLTSSTVSLRSIPLAFTTTNTASNASIANNSSNSTSNGGGNTNTVTVNSGASNMSRPVSAVSVSGGGNTAAVANSSGTGGGNNSGRVAPSDVVTTVTTGTSGAAHTRNSSSSNHSSILLPVSVPSPSPSAANTNANNNNAENK